MALDAEVLEALRTVTGLEHITADAGGGDLVDLEGHGSLDLGGGEVGDVVLGDVAGLSSHSP